MPSILITLLFLLLWALCAILIIELVLLILGLFLPVPARVRQILYAICGVILLIYLISALLGAAPVLPVYRVR